MTASVHRSESRFSISRMRRTVLPPVLFAGGVIGFWYLVAQIVPERKQILMPVPHQLWANVVEREEIRADLFDGLLNTARVALTALAIAIVLGVAVATLMSQTRFAERALFPWAVVLQTIPTLALIPLIGVWFGFGFNSRGY